MAFNHFLCYPKAHWALLVLIPRWVGLCIFLDPLGLSNKLSCEGGSFSCHLNPHRFFQSEVLRLYFSALESGLYGLCRSPVVPPGLSTCKYGTAHSFSPCLESSLPQLPVCAPPTGLDECFFFNSLVGGLPYNLIFWQFWLFFVFKFVVVLVLVV